MRLWLDDLRPIPAGFDVAARTAVEAIALLKGGMVTHISLDHDLGSDEEGTGYSVAVWIEERAFSGELPRLTWAIHSANPVGRERMKAALRSADQFWESRFLVGLDSENASSNAQPSFIEIRYKADGLVDEVFLRDNSGKTFLDCERMGPCEFYLGIYPDWSYEARIYVWFAVDDHGTLDASFSIDTEGGGELEPPENGSGTLYIGQDVKVRFDRRGRVSRVSGGRGYAVFLLKRTGESWILGVGCKKLEPHYAILLRSADGKLTATFEKREEGSSSTDRAGVSSGRPPKRRG